MSLSFVANGNINPSRFVKIDTTADGKVLICAAASDPIIGISQKGVHNTPLTIGGQSLDDGYAATAGQNLVVYIPPDRTDIEVGAAVTRGDRLISDGSGRGITTTVDGDFYGAIALASATAAGQLIPVEVFCGQRAS
jgi:hypothetical protein